MCFGRIQGIDDIDLNNTNIKPIINSLKKRFT
jgi:hypothetical protein